MGHCPSRDDSLSPVAVTSSTSTSETPLPCTSSSQPPPTSFMSSFQPPLSSPLSSSPFDLSQVPLLQRLSPSERSLLSASLTPLTVEAHTEIVREGEEGSTFYLIQEGSASVTKDHIDLCVLKEGDYFGEQALVHSAKRMATVTALTKMKLFTMDRDKFHQLFGDERLAINFVKRAAVSDEARSDHERDSSRRETGSLLQQQSLIGQRKREKTESQRAMLLQAVDRNVLFDRLSVEQKRAAVALMWLELIPQKTTVIKQGDIGSLFYVIESGTFDIFVQQTHVLHAQAKHTAQVAPVAVGLTHVATRTCAESFGELALLYNSPRAATVIARTDAAVWVMSRSEFRQVVEKGRRERLAEYESVLKRVMSFEVLLDYERAQIAEALEEISYPQNAIIFRQHDPGDAFFILVEGEVRCTISDERGVENEVARYKIGDYFGERALVSNEKRAATVTALTAVKCLYLNREAFNLLLGSMEDIFKRRVQGYHNVNATPVRASQTNVVSPAPAAVVPEKNNQTANSSSAHVDSRSHLALASTVASEPQAAMSFQLSEFKIIGTLGKGSFGHVQLVRHYLTNQVYALKIVSKACVVKLGQQQHLIDERRTMLALQSPHLIRLYGTFQDRNALYFVMELCLGGELFSILRARSMFDEPTARFYTAAVVCAFEYMHERGIIYRDLKPENLLLDAKGYLKVTDFGFAKHIGDGRTWTLCGTPGYLFHLTSKDYLAPEVVSSAGHGKGVDWWTLGVLLFEMLASYPPFYSEDPMHTYSKIMRGSISFPSHFSRSATDLIARLLHPKPTKRLGVIAGGAQKVMMHPFFNGFDWDAFHRGEMKAPIVPIIDNETDLSNFEKYPDTDKMEPFFASPRASDWTSSF